MCRASYDDSNDLIVISGFVPYALPLVKPSMAKLFAVSEPSIAKLAAFYSTACQRTLLGSICNFLQHWLLVNQASVI